MRREKLKVRVGKTYEEDNSSYMMMDDSNFNNDKPGDDDGDENDQNGTPTAKLKKNLDLQAFSRTRNKENSELIQRENSDSIDRLSFS